MIDTSLGKDQAVEFQPLADPVVAYVDEMVEEKDSHVTVRRSYAPYDSSFTQQSSFLI